MRTVSFIGIAVCCLVLGCGDKGGEASSATASAQAKAKAKPSGSAIASAAPSATGSAASSATAEGSAAPASGDAFASFKDLDLSGFHKIWKGFSVKAPEGAVIKKGYGGPRIEKEKEFAIELSFADTHLQNTADATKDCASYDQVCAVVERTKDLVETSSRYKSEPKEKTTYAFHMLIRPGGSLMACKGSGDSREKLALLKQACNSVTKQ